MARLTTLWRRSIQHERRTYFPPEILSAHLRTGGQRGRCSGQGTVRRLQRTGVRWHSPPLHRARLQAMLGPSGAQNKHTRLNWPRSRGVIPVPSATCLSEGRSGKFYDQHMNSGSHRGRSPDIRDRTELGAMPHRAKRCARRPADSITYRRRLTSTTILHYGATGRTALRTKVEPCGRPYEPGRCRRTGALHRPTTLRQPADALRRQVKRDVLPSIHKETLSAVTGSTSRYPARPPPYFRPSTRRLDCSLPHGCSQQPIDACKHNHPNGDVDRVPHQRIEIPCRFKLQQGKANSCNDVRQYSGKKGLRISRHYASLFMLSKAAPAPRPADVHSSRFATSAHRRFPQARRFGSVAAANNVRAFRRATKSIFPSLKPPSSANCPRLSPRPQRRGLLSSRTSQQGTTRKASRPR
jgi:hypothetical protein